MLSADESAGRSAVLLLADDAPKPKKEKPPFEDESVFFASSLPVAAVAAAEEEEDDVPNTSPDVDVDVSDFLLGVEKSGIPPPLIPAPPALNGFPTNVSPGLLEVVGDVAVPPPKPPLLLPPLLNGFPEKVPTGLLDVVEVVAVSKSGVEVVVLSRCCSFFFAMILPKTFRILRASAAKDSATNFASSATSWADLLLLTESKLLVCFRFPSCC